VARAWGQSFWTGAAAQLGAPINEIYGQTECNLCITQAAGFMEVRPGSMGQALPGFDVAVLRDGAAVPDGELGEIAVRRGTPAMFLGYWNQPEKTEAKFAGDWMLTGDLGRCEDGYFTYVARADDIISSAGYRIGPSEIEHCLMGHPDVVMAAAVGVPDPCGARWCGPMSCCARARIGRGWKRH
jgi:acetyl-CoA synthetase